MLDALKNEPNLAYETVKSNLVELRFRIQDQLKRSSCLILTREESKIYQKPLDGWEEIVAWFPQTVGDLEEAQACFALARYAASVFHALQVVETGLTVLGTFIGVEDPKSGWTAVTRRLSEQRNFPLLQQIHGTAEVMKDAWRNKISHSQGRLF